MKHIALGVALGAICILSAAADASTPRAWRVGGVDGWTAARRESVAVTSEGYAGLAYAVQPTEGIEGFMVWAMLPDGDDVLVATGDQGTLYRVRPGAAAVAAAKVVQPEITSLGRDGKGRVLFGAAPDGMVYRLEGGKAVPVADTPESYVWRILPDGADGALLAAGNAGKIYRMSGGGALEVVADLKCGHATGMVRQGNRLLVTTESPGRLLSVSMDGSIEVLYEATEGEVREPLPVGDAVYFLANPSEANANGRLYRRSAEGAVEQVWSTTGGSAFGLSAGLDGTLLVTAGADDGHGSVTRVRPGPPSGWMELVAVSEPQVICAVLDEAGEGWIGTGGRAAVYRTLGAGSYEGTVTSTTLDAEGSARWGSVALEPPVDAAGVRLEARSGNTRVPDDSWSAWQPAALDRGRGMIEAPSARFLQWRLHLSDPSVRVAAVNVAYLPANLAPRVNEVAVTRLGEKLERMWDRGQPSSLSQELPGGLRVEFQMPSAGGDDGPADDPEAAWARRYRTVTWKAADPNNDPLRFTLELRGAQDAVWKPLVEDEEGSPWVWDSATVPDGWYVLRVSASDRLANPPALAASAHRDTEPFLVDNTPPALNGLRVEGGILTGVAEDAAGTIASIEWSVDGGDWTRAFPEDGIPDMPREAFRIALDGVERGDHVVLVRTADGAGNLGVARVSFHAP